jgi:hypothetical protein
MSDTTPPEDPLARRQRLLRAKCQRLLNRRFGDARPVPRWPGFAYALLTRIQEFFHFDDRAHERNFFAPAAEKARSWAMRYAPLDLANRLDPQHSDHPRGTFPVIDVLRYLHDLAAWQQAAAKPDQANVRKSKRPKKGTAKGDAYTKLVAALTRHHQYADGGCGNFEPISASQLAEDAEVAESSASRFLKKVFGGYAAYCAACRDGVTLARRLRQLNGDYSDDALYDGQCPPDEGHRRGED